MSAVALAVWRKYLRLRGDKVMLVGNCIVSPFLIVFNLRTLRGDALSANHCDTHECRASVGVDGYREIRK
jgi:hypothetical protein